MINKDIYVFVDHVTSMKMADEILQDITRLREVDLIHCSLGYAVISEHILRIKFISTFCEISKGLVSSGNKPLHETMLTQLYIAIWHNKTAISYLTEAIFLIARVSVPTRFSGEHFSVNLWDISEIYLLNKIYIQHCKQVLFFVFCFFFCFHFVGALLNKRSNI